VLYINRLEKHRSLNGEKKVARMVSYSYKSFTSNILIIKLDYSLTGC
jgi:hypothetical protein